MLDKYCRSYFPNSKSPKCMILANHHFLMIVMRKLSWQLGRASCTATPSKFFVHDHRSGSGYAKYYHWQLSPVLFRWNAGVTTRHSHQRTLVNRIWKGVQTRAQRIIGLKITRRPMVLESVRPKTILCLRFRGYRDHLGSWDVRLAGFKGRLLSSVAEDLELSSASAQMFCFF